MNGVMPLTRAVREALGPKPTLAVLSDLLFLERWEIQPMPGSAAALRIGQIRRANPALADAVRAELARAR